MEKGRDPPPATTSCCFHFCISPLPSTKYSILKSVKSAKKLPSQKQQKLDLITTLFVVIVFLLLSLLFNAGKVLHGSGTSSSFVHRKKYFELVPSGSLDVSLRKSAMVPLPVRDFKEMNYSDVEREFWTVRENMNVGRTPCIVFSLKYRKASRRIVAEKRKFLEVLVSGGLNQQRNQIIDAVVISRILGAALVVPILKVNAVWGDGSKFSDIFDVNHFKRTLRSDIRIVGTESLPDYYKIHSVGGEIQIPFNSSPLLIRRLLGNQLNKHGVVTLGGLDSKLSKRLNSDLQKLRCKVSFHALRFHPRVHDLGNKLARRMWDQGPYVGIHLRLEKDVWVRTGCLPDLGPELDLAIIQERHSHPELLTGRFEMSPARRKLAGLCPLTAYELARFLKAMGVEETARLYLAGGEPYGGESGVVDLLTQFPNFVTKETLAEEEELNPYLNSSSALAALDFMITLSSDVFVASHGGNMGRALRGYRSYCGGGGSMGGRRKTMKPNKRGLAVLFGKKVTNETEEAIGVAVRKMHRYRKDRYGGRDDDVVSNPTAVCMCRSRTNGVLTSSLEL